MDVVMGAPSIQAQENQLSVPFSGVINGQKIYKRDSVQADVPVGGKAPNRQGSNDGGRYRKLPHAPVTISAFRDSEGLTDRIQQGEFLFGVATRDAEENILKVLSLSALNHILANGHKAVRTTMQGVNDFGELRKASKKIGHKRVRNDSVGLLQEIQNDMIFGLPRFNDLVTFLGPTLIPGNIHVDRANYHGRNVGLKMLVTQSRGVAHVPNLWGDVQLGDEVGFVVKKFQNPKFENVTISNLCEKTAPLQLYPKISDGGRNAYGSMRRCQSTVVGEKKITNSKGRPLDRFPADANLTSAQRSVAWDEYNPRYVDKSFIDLSVDEAVHPQDGSKTYVATTVYEVGRFIPVGRVYKKDSPTPPTAMIRSAVLPGESIDATLAAYRQLMNDYSISIFVDTEYVHACS